MAREGKVDLDENLRTAEIDELEAVITELEKVYGTVQRAEHERFEGDNYSQVIETLDILIAKNGRSDSVMMRRLIGIAFLLKVGRLR